MGISCKKDIGKYGEKTLKNKPRNTGADVGNGGVPVITNENNWAVWRYLSAEKIVPYSYWQNCQLFDNFKTFFREKVKELRFKNDLEDVSK